MGAGMCVRIGVGVCVAAAVDVNRSSAIGSSSSSRSPVLVGPAGAGLASLGSEEQLRRPVPTSLPADVRQMLATATIEKVTQRQRPRSKNGGPVGSSALRHSSNDTLAANPAAPVVEESGDEISKELLVLGITLALLHIAMCIMACG
ncbi:unnamed protein product, partial [Polarella glacialis]